MPGYAPALIVDWLREQGHNVEVVYNPSKSTRGQREKFFPIYSHWLNTKHLIRTTKLLARKLPELEFDLAIAPDTALALGIVALKRKRLVKKTVYWRLDYYPKKYPGPANWIYQAAEALALVWSDEIWSISSLLDKKVRKSLKRHLKKTIHVPYLLPKIPNLWPTDLRKDTVVWLGTDLDGGESRYLAQTAVARAAVIGKDYRRGVGLTVADYSNPNYVQTEEQLQKTLDTAKIGLAIYKPEKGSCKYYSDPGRIKHYLAHGLPVIVTKVAPIWRQIDLKGAGIVVEWDPDSIAEAINIILTNWGWYSKNARELGETFLVSDKWIKL
ncbi:hypothetical protein LCGC14_0422330 [marine sediment metagenome]|uniref:Glycosyltransferase subfamily 4-like N-terminal domain-containing protein n=1 Tax=marine sediment metagenome TaxID=412755 RepID=A0A0F9VZW2_9ZZZZ